jgi:hypothetical protein
MLSLYDTLSNSYKPIKEQKQFYKQHGYYLDKKLSNDNHQVMYNPTERKLLYTVAGTHNLKDWLVNSTIGIGQFKNTQRFQQSDKAFKEAKRKYNPLESVVAGHSQGGMTAGYIAGKNDKVLTLDRAHFIGNTIRPNETAYRVEGDIVSKLGGGHKNFKTLSNNSIWIDPVSSHNVEHIKNTKILI